MYYTARVLYFNTFYYYLVDSLPPPLHEFLITLLAHAGLRSSIACEQLVNLGCFIQRVYTICNHKELGDQNFFMLARKI